MPQSFTDLSLEWIEGVKRGEEVRGGGQGWVQVSVHITVRPRQIAKLL